MLGARCVPSPAGVLGVPGGTSPRASFLLSHSCVAATDLALSLPATSSFSAVQMVMLTDEKVYEL